MYKWMHIVDASIGEHLPTVRSANWWKADFETKIIVWIYFGAVAFVTQNVFICYEPLSIF